ncbi:hypothetical protein [uncultured Microbulbifer sp.]|uniref:hypothetical protein n=1 Tax=uncultured Microbulbifer sp. TaxID=348147 RepID=UPI0025FA9129|nr:hypothetical protein [uncultured Microbulbifer sp.]
MSTPQTAVKTSPQNSPQSYPLIAGQRAGKRISCTPELKPVYDRLLQAANRNHHWARIAVKELNALTTGMLGKNNVYVRPGEHQRGCGSEKYYVFLPGLKATVVRWINDQFCITELVMDENYYEVVKNGSDFKRMGLYRTSKGRVEGSWDLEYVKDGAILGDSDRVVSIADAKCASAGDAARKSLEAVWDFLGNNKSGVRNGGFDLHFTPGPNRLGGLVQYNALTINDSRGSAVHLASSMERARSIQNVCWVADFGGSAVLTQAMQILVDKGVSLKGHTVYFHKPRTSPARALKLAHTLDLTLNERFANTGYSVSGALSQFSVAGVRIRNRKDPYNRGHHASNWFKGAVAVSTPIGVAAALTGGSAGVIMGGIATVIGGSGVVYSVGQSVAQDMRRRFKF